MSIFKDTFRNYVRDQLAIREELIAIGNDDGGQRSSRINPQPVKLQSGIAPTIDPGAFYSYTLNKQCGIRMTSLVDYVSDVNLEIGGYGNQGDAGFKRLKGSSLSQNFILEGGVLSDFARNINGKKILKRATTPRESFPRPGLRTNLGYGDLGLGANATPDGYGIVPMPGITDATIRTKSAYGSLREAKINFECHNRRQLEVLEMLYMRPGYMALVEWGWAPYINNAGSIISNLRLVEDALRIDDNESLIYTNEATQQMVHNAINKLKEQQNGNYDGFLGFVKNFGFKARGDGGYSCFTEMISMGEVLNSIKAPAISNFDPAMAVITGYDKNKTQEEIDNPTEITITTNLGLSYGDTDPYKTVSLGQEEFQDAVEKNIFPSYGGLEGLTKSLKNYATFNSFTIGAVTQTEYERYGSSNLEGEILYGDEIDDIFPELDEDYVSDAAASGETDDDKNKNKEAANAKLQTLDSELTSAGYDSAGVGDTMPRKRYLRDLLQFQAQTVQTNLFKKLSVDTPEELRNFIIPRGGFATDSTGKIKESTESNGVWIEPIGSSNDYYAELRNDQPFIRWDALCVLINDALITTNENSKTPLNVVPDRIYDVDNNISNYEVLKYAPITEYNEETEENNTIDFSTDANVCILPNQFYSVGSNIIKGNLGYEPDLQVFGRDYVMGVYEKTFVEPIREVQYNGKSISDLKKLSIKDSKRRIGNIFLNLNMIDEVATKNGDDPDYTVGDFINDIWGEVNKVCPNHNFVLVDDKESTNVYIIDLPVDSSEVPTDLHEFIPFSNKNILRDFEYTSNVPSAMSATIAVQAQDPRSIQDIDGVTFAAFNRAIKNRLLSKDTIPSFEKAKIDIESESSRLYKRRKELRRILDSYRNTFFRNLSLTANEKSTKGGNIDGTLKEFQKSSTYINTAIDNPSTFNAVIPLEFSATLDGISGIVIGNLFKVKKDRLPKAYAKTNIGFIVFNEEQKITAGGDWTTEISGKMTILPDPNKLVKKISNAQKEKDQSEVENRKSAQATSLESVGMISNVEINGYPSPEDPTTGYITIRIVQDKGIYFEPPSTYRQNSAGASVPSIIPDRAFKTFDSDPSADYHFTIENVKFGISMTGGQPVKFLNLLAAEVEGLVFQQNKVVIQCTQAQHTQQATVPGQDPPLPDAEPALPIIIDLKEEFTTISDNEGTKFLLFPDLSI
tara:strand:- start:1711 stop:5283 length:3573 start_codon:yes stop_codon:yes gene_type:complete